MQGVTIRFRTDQNNQRYGFGLTITREMTKTKSSPEGINVFILSDQISLKIDVYINLRCVYTVRHRDRDRQKLACKELCGGVHTAQRQIQCKVHWAV